MSRILLYDISRLMGLSHGRLYTQLNMCGLLQLQREPQLSSQIMFRIRKSSLKKYLKKNDIKQSNHSNVLYSRRALHVKYMSGDGALF